MAGPVSLLFVVRAKEDETVAFEELIVSLVNTARDEPGMLVYEWSRSSSVRDFHGYERYADSDAVLEHMARFRDGFAERFFTLVDLVSFTAYGDPDDQCRAALVAGGAELLAPIDGFAR